MGPTHTEGGNLQCPGQDRGTCTNIRATGWLLVLYALLIQRNPHTQWQQFITAFYSCMKWEDYHSCSLFRAGVGAVIFITHYHHQYWAGVVLSFSLPHYHHQYWAGVVLSFSLPHYHHQYWAGVGAVIFITTLSSSILGWGGAVIFITQYHHQYWAEVGAVICMIIIIIIDNTIIITQTG